MGHRFKSYISRQYNSVHCTENIETWHKWLAHYSDKVRVDGSSPSVSTKGDNMNKGILEAKSTKESDEYYTPKEPVEAISSYLKEGSTVWCPFDKEQSQFVQVLRKKERI